MTLRIHRLQAALLTPTSPREWEIAVIIPAVWLLSLGGWTMLQPSADHH